MSKKAKDQQPQKSNGKATVGLTDEEIDKLSPILKRIYCLVADGQRHTREELWLCLEDEYAPIQGIFPHVTYLRRILNPKNLDVAFRGGKYALVTWNPAEYQ